ncbi:hypothetical protein [Paracoccus spongiarum]|uniref:Uncharacterized protein n=1 Tax=Paracoccus spongiarum TaxID=3064387 RepID=A0ABT9JFQ8_9RHOB|nr:hypothetical protein [Paracoccus sp. 2205BS29-5]MDP5308569.1 hypothetical protein [Paracoccus sp. 2205BS29-5]
MMLVPALFALTSSLAQAALPMPAELSDFAGEASGWLLAGERLPPDYRVRLLQMEPAARLQAIVYLRRIGLLTDPSWGLDDVLKPVPPAQEIRE